MKINIKATKVDLTPDLKALVQEKFSGLDKYYDKIVCIDLELGLEVAGQRKGDIYFCEVNVSVPGKLLRYRKAYSDLTQAINGVHKGIQLELIREKEKKLR